MEITRILTQQRAYFQLGKTLPVKTRIVSLKKLYSTIKKYEKEIALALYQDLGKSEYESYICEVGLVLSEISHMIVHMRKYAAEKKVKTSIAHFPAKSYIKPVPYGNVLILSPWNYPFLLTMEPLVNALAAGNTAVVKPSAYSIATSRIVGKIIKECFSEELVAAVAGGRKENQELLNQKFDMIFFTGGTSVGKEVLRRAAETLTPAVLELGGKSPCIVDKSAKVQLAAKRIVMGKFVNCGQTCVAPDYVLCHSSVKDQFLKEVKHQIELQFGQNPLENPTYGKIINKKHFERLCGLLNERKLVHGGKISPETLQIEPSVLDHVNWEDAVMQEEIFGPILPIMSYESIDEVLHLLKQKPKPLALYVFSEHREVIRKVTNECQYGGGCINDVISHVASSELPFGGVGESGMGCYHGKAGFDAFSHIKGIMEKKTWLDLPMRYQPYTRTFFSKLAHWIQK